MKTAATTSATCDQFGKQTISLFLRIEHAVLEE